MVSSFKYAGVPVMKGPVSRTTPAFADFSCMSQASKAADAVFTYLKELASKRSGLPNAQVFYPRRTAEDDLPA